MAMKHYPAEFKADPVALYRPRPGATIAQIAAELGLNREPLRNWIRRDDQARPATATAPARGRTPGIPPRVGSPRSRPCGSTSGTRSRRL
ncbi:transposase [Nocardiopsis lambiniae]|uniref:Transposase n=1 Tax=Nocardiopsis lambiniae TaxID=3075539 RepID=A0ABU2M2X4_9ACTN|nr:transposase [Nocardiopsis sp. DSM 44743]MDT0327000.1 transposase [Nocardiopsis sp. DSM 44743]